VPPLSTRLLVAVALVALATLPYVDALDGGFFYDDWHYILDGATSRGPQIRPDLDVSFGKIAHVRQLRTLTALTYRGDYRRGGAEPSRVDAHPFHTTNLAIHAAAVLALWGLWRLVTRRLRLEHGFWVATFAAAAFGIHPLATEAVNYPTARGSSLVALGSFLFAGLVALGAERRGGRRALAWAAAAVVALLAAYSKEVGVVLPWGVALGVVCAVHAEGIRARWASASRSRKWLFALGPPLVVVALLGWLLAPGLDPLRPAGLNEIHDKLENKFTVSGTITDEVYGIGGPYVHSPSNYWQMQTRCFWRWASLVVAPWERQSIDHVVVWNDGPFRPWYTPFAWIGLCGVALVAAAGVLSLRPQRRLAALGVWIALVGLAPNSFTPGLQPLLEYRYITGLAGATPALALALLAAAAWVGRRIGWPVARAGVVVAVVTVVALGAGTVMRNRDWRDGAALWQDVLERNPERLRAWNELAMHYFHTRFQGPERLARSAKILLDLRRDHPEYVGGLSNLGAMLSALGRRDEAIAVLEEMRDAPEPLPNGLVQLGMLYQDAGRYDDALAMWREGEGFGKALAMLCFTLRARLANDLARYDEVVAVTEGFRRVSATSRIVHNVGEMALLRANALFRLAQLRPALVAAQEAEALADTYERRARAIVLRADTHKELAQAPAAARHYERAVDSMLTSGVRAPGLLEPVGKMALEMRLHTRELARVRAIYDRVIAALPDERREAWRTENEWMTRVEFGEPGEVNPSPAD